MNWFASRCIAVAALMALASIGVFATNASAQQIPLPPLRPQWINPNTQRLPAALRRGEHHLTTRSIHFALCKLDSRHGLLNKAVAECTRAMSGGTQRQRVRARFYRARIFFAKRDYPAAAEDFQAIIRSGHHWGKAEGGLAWSMYQLGHDAAAAKHATAAVRHSPDDYYAWDTLARTELALRNEPAAARAARAAWQLSPEREREPPLLFLVNQVHGYPWPLRFDLG